MTYKYFAYDKDSEMIKEITKENLLIIIKGSPVSILDLHLGKKLETPHKVISAQKN